MSDHNHTSAPNNLPREEYPFRKSNKLPFLLCLPVLLFFVLYQDTPKLMRGLSTIVLMLASTFFFLTLRRFKGVFFEADTIKITNGIRTIQQVEISSIEKITKDGASYAVDYTDSKSDKLSRASFLKANFTDEVWQKLDRRLASIR